jgi:hypothetical protein
LPEFVLLELLDVVLFPEVEVLAEEVVEPEFEVEEPWLEDAILSLSDVVEVEFASPSPLLLSELEELEELSELS